MPETKDTILEVAFDIRGRSNLQTTMPETQEGPWRADIFAVFHFHVFGLTPAPNGPDTADTFLSRIPWSTSSP